MLTIIKVICKFDPIPTLPENREHPGNFKTSQ